MPETQVESLGRDDPLEKGMATHSSILAWRIPWTEKAGGLQSMGVTKSWTRLSDSCACVRAHTHTHTHTDILYRESLPKLDISYILKRHHPVIRFLKSHLFLPSPQVLSASKELLALSLPAIITV